MRLGVGRIDVVIRGNGRVDWHMDAETRRPYFKFVSMGKALLAFQRFAIHQRTIFAFEILYMDSKRIGSQGAMDLAYQRTFHEQVTVFAITDYENLRG